MKKTISVNIAGYVFNIEEEAYERLNQYLAKIKNNFGNAAERDEIMDDIELRIAELFQEKLAKNREVIIGADITEVIDILGHPEDFATDDDGVFEESTNAEYVNVESKKRLFRDKDNGQIGGVCSGLGHYFDVDPLIFRIMFILLLVFFGSGILMYIVLMIVIPEAKTTSDKIEMKGRSVNVETIKEHLAGIKDAVKEGAKKSQIKKTLENGVEKGVNAGRTVVDVIAKIVGIGFIIGGVFLITFLMLFFFADLNIIPFIGPERVADLQTLIAITYPGESPSSFIFISIIIVSVIPIVWLLIAGIKLLTKNLQNVKQILWTLAIIWTVSACFLFVMSVKLGAEFKNDKWISESQTIITTSDTLHILVLNDDKFSNHVDPYDRWGSAELLRSDNHYIYFGYIRLIISPTVAGAPFTLQTKKHSRGSTERDAINKI